MEMWLLLLFFLAIGASLVALGLRRRAHLAAGFDVEIPPEAWPAAQPPTAVDLPPDLAWLRRLLFAVHALIIGQTRSGKTTITHFVATSRARLGQRVIVCDPDAALGMWPGCTVSGYGDDFAAIEATLCELLPELAARREARTQRAKSRLTPLTLVFSEAGDIMNKCPTARPLFEQVLRRGGKLNVSLLVDVQDKQKDTLKLPGATHLLKNFDEQVEVLKEGDTRLVIAQGERYPIPTLPDPEALADAHAAAQRDDQAQLAALLAHVPAPVGVPHDEPTANGSVAQQHAPEHTAGRSENGQVASGPAADATDDPRSLNAIEPPVTLDELRQLGRALQALATGEASGKHEAIYLGWGLKRGGGPRYKRAEALFEAARAEE